MAVSQERVVQVGPVDGLGALTDVDLAAKDAEVGAASRLNLVVTPFRYWGVTIGCLSLSANPVPLTDFSEGL